MMQKPRVLIVEDNGDLRELYSFVLARAGMEVRQADDGQQALALLRRDPPDLLVTDVMMPRLTGVELVERVRADAEPPSLPMVVISDFPDYLTKAYVGGATEAIRKPVEPSHLLDAVLLLLPAGTPH
jgi:CheY-like chemotaxis protein